MDRSDAWTAVATAIRTRRKLLSDAAQELSENSGVSDRFPENTYSFWARLLQEAPNWKSVADGGGDALWPEPTWQAFVYEHMRVRKQRHTYNENAGTENPPVGGRWWPLCPACCTKAKKADFKPDYFGCDCEHERLWTGLMTEMFFKDRTHCYQWFLCRNLWQCCLDYGRGCGLLQLAVVCVVCGCAPGVLQDYMADTSGEMRAVQRELGVGNASKRNVDKRLYSSVRKYIARLTEFASLNFETLNNRAPRLPTDWNPILDFGYFLGACQACLFHWFGFSARGGNRKTA